MGRRGLFAACGILELVENIDPAGVIHEQIAIVADTKRIGAESEAVRLLLGVGDGTEGRRAELVRDYGGVAILPRRELDQLIAAVP
jgi:hypothetical protein